MPGRVTLTVTAGPLSGRTFDFVDHDTFIFGRAADCHAALSPNDRSASRHHFLLEVNPPYARLRDLGSLNGTFVNSLKTGGRPDDETPEQAAARTFPEVDLRHGDRIRVGQTVFEVAIESPVPSPVVAIDEQSTRAPFERGRMLGKGGMGAVYLGRRESDNRTVAIKMMLPKVAVDPYARAMFLREIDVTRSLTHPHVIELLEFGEDSGGFYFLMEYCEDGNLEDLRGRRGGRIPWSEAVPLVMQILEGLAYAHERGFVHRDIKPQNILLTRGGQLAKLSDFGLAKSFERAGLSGFTAAGAVGGTRFFMPREQLTNYKFVRPVSDVWSMGAVLYVCITGHPPRDMRKGDDPVEVILRGDITPIRARGVAVPDALAEAIDRALANKAADRFQTADEFRAALAAAAAARD